ncbi:MAG TPA: hypothetical protein VFA61_12280 [Candidatus Udaeobacter sp.]|nr:hypothetical protein [Candidatus Udaeobacter sp.]
MNQVQNGCTDSLPVADLPVQCDASSPEVATVFTWSLTEIIGALAWHARANMSTIPFTPKRRSTSSTAAN